MARLVVEIGENSGMIYSLPLRSTTLGRGDTCGICLSDRRISRQQARIVPNGAGYELEDLNSRNGTLLNHEPVTARTPLRHGDSIIVGATKLIFELDSHELSDYSASSARVLMAGDLHHQVQAQKSVDGDTAPVVQMAGVSRQRIADPLERLRVLYQMSDALRGELDPKVVLSKTMQLIWRVMAPDRGIILLQEKGRPATELAPAVIRTDDVANADIVISRQVVDKCIREKMAILMTDAPNDPHFNASDSIIRNKIRSIICAPLVAHGRPFGVIYIDLHDASIHTGNGFTIDDLELMTGIANQVALAVDNARLYENALSHQRLERELEIARDIQEQLLPTNYPSIPGLECAAVCNPARQVGGDYYDFFKAGDDRTAIVVGDASGKGVPAAISVAMVRTTLRAYFHTQLDAGLTAIMNSMNTAFGKDSVRDTFMTVCTMLYDPATQAITYSSAGHVPPVLFRRDGAIEKLSAGGPLLGAVTDAEYTQETVRLQPGDVVVMYSDGVTDTHNLNGDLFGEQRLFDAITESRHLSAGKICDYIRESVVGFRETREPFDDVTLVILKGTAINDSDNLTQVND